MEILNIISGPVIGALIGYSTNYLAIKMLFRPYKEKRIGKIKIPFTPGIIPKRRYELSKAIGNAISDKLLTKDDLVNSFVNNKNKDKIVGNIMMKLYSNNSFNDELNGLNLDIDYNKAKENISLFISKKIINIVLKSDIESKIIELGMDYYNSKKDSLGMLSMFIKDEMVEGIIKDLSNGIINKIKDNGIEIINPYILNEIDSFSNTPLNELSINLNKDKIFNLFSTLYDYIVKESLKSFVDNINISEIVENKINEMDIKDLEKLILSVMKKELNAIVNLGAVLGLLIGILNIFI